MSGMLHMEVETIYDSGYRPSFDSARDVLAFLLTPIDVIGPLEPGEVEMVSEIFAEAKRQAFEEWQRRRQLRSR